MLTQKPSTIAYGGSALAAYAGRFREYNVVLRSSGYPRVALVYPSTYQASITNLFTHTAYYFLVERSDALVDRFTLDNPMRGALTGRKLKDFDLLLISANYELDIVYAVKLLSEAQLTPSAEGRSMRPVIVVGGLAAMSNPEPFLEIADGVFIGDGEILLQKVARYMSLLPDKPVDFLDSVGDGMYTGKSVVRKVYVENLDGSMHPTAEIRSKITEPVYGEGYYLEISRGCRWLCKFCLEGYSMHPYRFRSLTTVKRLVEEGLKYVPKRRVIIYSLSPFDHPGLRDLLASLSSSGIDFSLPSIRWDTLRVEDLDLIATSTQKTLTLAPETAGPILSCSIGKCFDAERFSELAISALERGFDLKLYMMVGLPDEKDEDLLVSINTTKSLASHARKLGRKISLSLNPLVPKPHTPLQDHPMLEEEEYLRRAKLFERELGKGVVSYLSWFHAYLQALIALGDRKVGKLAVYLGTSGISRRNLIDFASRLGVDLAFPMGRRSKNDRPWQKVIFPLDHIIDKTTQIA